MDDQSVLLLFNRGDIAAVASVGLGTKEHKNSDFF